MASLVIAMIGISRRGQSRALAMASAGVIFLVGMFLCTTLLNVPLNNALAAVDPASRTAASAWPRYLKAWTWWNHVRAISSTAACALYIAALAAK